MTWVPYEEASAAVTASPEQEAEAMAAGTGQNPNIVH